MKYFCHLFLLLGLNVFSQSSDYQITNLDINNEYPHFGLMQVGERGVIFTSYLLNKNGKVKVVGGEPILTLYTGELSSENNIINIEPLKIDENIKIPTITSATISPNGKKLYITTLYTKKNKPKGEFKATNFHLEEATFKEGLGWTDFKVLPFCKPRYSYAHPSFSEDGKTLYFTSNIRGGKNTTKGGSDLFKVSVNEDGTYGEPKNLGSKVNSYSREMFPIVNRNALYFSSNRPGYGGFDLYKSEILENGEFKKAIKLPKPINSAKDDLSLVMISDSSGFLVSKRLEGKGDDDIYYFTEN